MLREGFGAKKNNKTTNITRRRRRFGTLEGSKACLLGEVVPPIWLTTHLRWKRDSKVLRSDHKYQQQSSDAVADACAL